MARQNLSKEAEALLTAYKQENNNAWPYTAPPTRMQSSAARRRGQPVTLLSCHRHKIGERTVLQERLNCHLLAALNLTSRPVRMCLQSTARG